MIVNVQFWSPNSISFIKGQKYIFSHPSGNTISGVYLGTSRIDGNDMFDFSINNSVYPLVSFNYNGNQFKNINLIGTSNRSEAIDNYQSNKDTLLKVFMEEYSINDDDLYDNYKFKSILRNLKLNKILNDDANIS